MVTEDTSIFLVIMLSIGGISMMTVLLACYVCIFRDLCCRAQDFRPKKSAARRARVKRRKKIKGQNIRFIILGEAKLLKFQVRFLKQVMAVTIRNTKPLMWWHFVTLPNRRIACSRNRKTCSCIRFVNSYHD